MKYFELLCDPSVSNALCIQPDNIALYRDFTSLEVIPDLTVAYFQNSIKLEVYDIMFGSAIWLSDKLKRLIELYEPNISFKGIRLYPEDLNDTCSYLYWWANFPRIDFSFDSNQELPNPLKLDENLIDRKNIFLIDKILQRRLIVSLPLAESMLRRDMAGFILKPVTTYFQTA